MRDRPLDDALLSLLESRIDSHKQWLTEYPTAEQRWTKMLRDAPESAIVEACSRDSLQRSAGALELVTRHANAPRDGEVARLLGGVEEHVVARRDGLEVELDAGILDARAAVGR